MKKFKKLIPAFCMLLVSAILLGSSTYAWFSMNDTVKATGMQINAQADTTYLLISDTKTTADEIQAEAKTDVSLGAAQSLYPAALKTATTNPFTDADDNWWYAEASLKTASDKKTGTEVEFGEAKSNKTGTVVADSTTFGERVLKKTVYLTLADGSKTPAGALMVHLENFTDNVGGAAKIVIATADKALYFTSANAATAQELVAAGTMNDTTVIVVNIYMYFDGENENVYTDNISALTSATADIIFKIG